MKLRASINLLIGILLTDFIFLVIAFVILEGYKYSHNVNKIEYFMLKDMSFTEKIAYLSIYLIVLVNITLIVYALIKINKKNAIVLKKFLK
ncbi:hypothetical protein CW733_00955 [Lacinutrix sp. Bg11-31]|nr:hypothetical protein CW733_00955 [Lacinutrix sp. Bg11-31]